MSSSSGSPAGPERRVADLLLAAAERSPDLIGLADDRGQMLYLNPAARRRLTDDELDGTAPLTTASLFPPELFSRYYDEIRPALVRGERWTGWAPTVDAQGRSLQLWVTAVGGVNVGGEVEWVMMSARDLSAMGQSEAELARLATHDDLTGVANRAVLATTLAAAIARTDRDESLVAVLFVDLDRLKTINDTLGHATGDAVLREVARRMVMCVRPGDTVARLGGDEFVVVCEGLANETDAVALAERLREALVTDPVTTDSGAVPISVSIGVALAGHGEPTAEELLRHADVAMYEVKRDEASVGLFDDEMRQRVARSSHLAHELAVAVTRKAVVAYLQPIVTLADQEVVGYHALARWDTDDSGILDAEMFIGVAARSGLGAAIDLAVLRQSVQSLVRSTAPNAVGSGPELHVSISSRLLVEPHLASLLKEVLDQASLRADRLVLRVSERMFSTGRRGPNVIDAVAGLGVRLAVSEVGGGTWSLRELARTPISDLVLDRELVTRVLDDADAAEATAGAIGLAHGLGLRAIAVGVESPEQRDALVEMGADLGQGHLFGRPEPRVTRA